MCVQRLLTLEKWLEVWVNICTLLRDVEVTGELVREIPTRLNDGALGTQRVDKTFVTEFLFTHCNTPTTILLTNTWAVKSAS